ncbi:MAG: helicase [Rhodocyclaceae bacterium]|nr:MAG: helicase [Rhodocyclaceae bacterium]
MKLSEPVADLLSEDDLAAWLPAQALADGREFTEAVSALVRDGDTIAARVKDANHPRPYRVAITLGSEPGEAPRLLHCTCNVPRACKHVAATLLVALRKQESVRRGNLPPPPGRAFNVPWMAALSQIVDAPSASEAAPKANPRLYWQLVPAGAKEFRLLCFKGLLAPGQRFTGGGGLKPWNNFSPSVSKPPRFVDEDDLFAMRLLLAQEGPGKRSREEDGLTALGRHTAEVLPRLAESGRLYADFQPPVPLAAGEARAARIAWRKDDKGLHHPVVETTPPIDWVLPSVPPMYVDGKLKETGLLQFDLPAATAARILAAPPLTEAEAQLTALVLEEASPGTPLPAAAQAREIDAAPQPVLQLGTAHIARIRNLRGYPQNRWNTPLDYAQVFFNYGEAQLPARDDQSFVRLPGGETVKVLRRPEEEQAWLTALELADLGPIPADALELSHQSGVFDPKISFALHNEEDWPRFMSQRLPQLREAGWEVRMPPDFRHHALEVESWEVEIDEDELGWFNLDMGIIVDGQRLPLAPLLASLFQRDERWLEASQIDKIGNGEVIDLLTPQGFRVRVPAGRIKPLARTLIDLFDGILDASQQKLRLSRLDAPRLASLDNGQWNSTGLDAVRKAVKQLAGMTGVKPVAAPEGFALTLRPYQEDGLAWLQYLRQYDLAGILADDMGLGKTAQALAHLLLEKEAGRLGARARDADLKDPDGPRPALVVLPTSLVFNWKTEVERFAPALSLLFLHGKERKEAFAEIPHHDVIITTYPLIWRDAEELVRYDFHLLVLDEAQTVKNSASKCAAVIRQLKARHRLCLTGTPLENHLGELWSQFDFLLPGFLGDKKSFARAWRTPIEKHGNMLRRDLLAGRIRPFVLRRRKEEVAKELPPKNVIIRTVQLEAGQRDLYEAVRSIMDARIRQEIASRGFARSQIVILDALLKLRQVCCDPRLVKSETAKKVKERAKLDLLMDMLPELVDEGRRILVFSQFTSMLALIETELKQIGLDYVVLTGDTKDRETPIRRFQEGQVPIFLVSLKAGGVGLNLTAADTVIHYDPWWNPAVENQATDRAHRIGQTKTVFVYKLVVAGSIEEKILAMQEQKAALAAGILSEDKTGEVKFSEADLHALLAPLPDE